MELLRVLAMCLLTALLAVVFKQYKSEYALFTVLAGGATVLLMAFYDLAKPLETLQNAIARYGVDTGVFGVALKALGIGYITEFIANACRDSGQTSLAAKAELAGKCAIFLLVLPLMLSVLELAVGLIQ